MKLKFYFLLMALGLLSLGLQSCDDDDDDNAAVPTQLRNALSDKYPGAQRVEWDVEGIYYVAEFYLNNKETEAWFTSDGVWQMTETDLVYNDLPAAVRSAFQESAYASWRLEDVDKVERTGMEAFYVLEVEQGNAEVDLHYSEDGILIREVTDGMGNYHPSVQPESNVLTTIRTYIESNYPGARIIEIEQERGQYEADIIHENRSKDVYFSSEGTWISTSWDLMYGELPQAVSAAAQAAYPGYVLDDADYVETPSGDYYLVEMESGPAEVYLRITADGTIL